MDTGTGIVGAAAVISAAFTVVKSMSLIWASKNQINEQKKSGFPCAEHAGLMERLRNGDGRFADLGENLDTFKDGLVLILLALKDKIPEDKYDRIMQRLTRG